MAERKRWNTYDGDSLQTRDGTNRLASGDAPEVGDPGAAQSRRALQQALDNGARVEDTGEQGYHGRDLVEVRDEQGNVGDDMIRRGLNAPNSDETHLRFREQFKQATTGEKTRPELNEFVAESDAQEQDFYRTRFDQVMREAASQDLPSQESSPWARGVDNLQGSLYGLANVVGEVSGSDPLAEYGERGMLGNLLEAAKNPAEVQSYEDIDGLESGGMYVYETLAENAPQLGVDAAAGLFTGGLGAAAKRTALAGVGKAAMRKLGGVKASAEGGRVGRQLMREKTGLVRESMESGAGRFGAGASIEGQLVGETRQGQYREGLENEDGALAHAIGTGTLKAGLEYAGFQKILGNVFRGADGDSQKMITGLLRGNRDAKNFTQGLKRVMQLSGSSSMAEGMTEAGQSILDQMTMAGLDPERDANLGDLDTTELIDATLRGATFGGTVTAPGSAATSVADHFRSVREGQNERALLDDTVPEREDDLQAQARTKDKVFVSRNQTPDTVDRLRETMRKRGPLKEREGDDGTLLTLNEQDSLLDDSQPLDREQFLADRGQQTAANTEGNIGTAFLEDAEGNRIEERTVTDESVEDVRLALNERLKDFGIDGGRIGLELPQDTAARRTAIAEPEAESALDTESEQTEQTEQPTQPEQTEQPTQPEQTEQPTQPEQTEQPTQPEAPQAAEVEQVTESPSQEIGQAEQVTESPSQQSRQTEQVTAPEVEQAAETLPQPPTQPEDASGMRSIRNDDGTLRPPGEIMRDYREGRVDPKELAGEARSMGIDVKRFKDGKQAPADPQRTRARVRRLLWQNVSVAREISGRRAGTRGQVTQEAMDALDNAAEPMQAYQQVLDENFQGEPPARRRQIKRDDQARLQLVSRIKTKAKGASDARLKAIRREMAGDSVSDSEFREFFRPGNARLERQGTEQGLIALAEELGVEGVDQLTENRRGDTYDLAGLVRAMQERDPSEPTSTPSEIGLTDSELSEMGQAKRQAEDKDAIPPMQLVSERLDFIFDSDGLVMPLDTLIEIEGGIQNAVDRLESATQEAVNNVPEVISDLAQHLDHVRLDQLENRSGQDVLRERAELMRDAWKQVLEEAALEDMNLQRPPDMEGFNQRQSQREVITHQAAQDTNTLAQLVDRVMQSDAAMDTPEQALAELTRERLADAYAAQIQRIYGPDMVTDADRADMAQIREVDGLRQEGESIIARQLSHWEETQPDHLGSFDAQLEAFAEELMEAVRNNPTDPAGVVVDALFDTGMVGPGAAFARQQHLQDTVMDTPEQESARVSTSSQRGQQSLGEDATSAQELSEQQMSDVIFKKVFNTSAFRFRGFNAFKGKHQPRIISRPGEPRRYEPKHSGEGQPYPDNQPLADTHDVFVLDFETYYDDAYNMDAVNQDYQAFIEDERFEATVLTVRDPNSGEVELIEGQEAITEYLESFKNRDSNRPTAFVAHNAAFDNAVAGKLSDFQPDMWLDTKQLAGQLEEFREPSLSLHNLGKRFGLRSRKTDRSALESTKGVRDLSALSEGQRQVFADYAVADTEAAAELFDIVEEATPISALQINDAQTRLQSNPKLAREQPELLTRLARLGGLATRVRQSLNNATEQAQAIDNTRRAEGRNLLEVPVEQSIGDGSQQRVSAQSNYVDAVSFGEYTRAGEGRPHSSVEALTNLEANLARLAQGPESNISWGVEATEIRQVPDDTVIWFEGDAPVTAGQVRQRQVEMQDAAEQVRKRHEVREQAQIELEVTEHQLNRALDGLEDYYDRIENTELADAVRKFRASDFGDARSLVSDIREARNKLLDRESQQAILFADDQGGDTRVKLTREDFDGLLEAARQGDAELLSKRAARGIRRLDKAQDADSRRLSKALSELEAINAATKRIEQMAQFRTNEGRTERVQLPNGASATLRDLMNRRFDLLGRIKAASDYINRNRGDLQTSQRGEQHDADVPLNAGDPQDGRATDPSLEDQGDDPGVDSPTPQTSREVEGELHSELLNSGRGVFAEQQSSNQIDMTMDADGNELAQTGDSFENDIGTTQETQPAQLVNDPNRREFEQPGGTRLFGEDKLQRLGQAAESREFATLQNMTRRLLRQLDQDVPVTIIQTGDQGAIEQAKLAARTDQQRAVLDQIGQQPGYANIDGRAVITMDAKRPDGEPGQWYLTFAHELGHMVYDMHWHNADPADRTQVTQAFVGQTGATSLEAAEYNGKTGTAAFKEWYADQMAAHLVENVTGTNRREFMSYDLDELARTSEAGSFRRSTDLRRFFQGAIDKLKATWKAIQSGELVGSLGRFVKNADFSDYAERVLNGEVSLDHRTDLTPEALHFTPETADTAPGPKRGVTANANKAVKKPKQFQPKGLYRSTINRIKGYNNRLASMLFQQSQTRQSGGGSYENKRFTMEGRWSTWLEQAVDRMGGKVTGRQAVLDQAYTDLRDGVDSNGARELRKLIDNVMADAKREGWRDPGLGDGFMPLAFDHQTVQAKRGELIERARENMPDADETELNEIIDHIISGVGIGELSMTDVTSPGNPVGMHRGPRQLMDAVGEQWLADNGFMLDRGAGVVRHMISGLSKRAGWEAVFGKNRLDTRDMDAEQAELAQQRFEATGEGQLRFDPSGEYHDLVERIRAEHGELAANEVVDLVNGAIGNKNVNTNAMWRKSQEWMIGLTNLMILGFSGVATIPELGLAMSRANMGVSDVIRSMGSFGEARRLAKDLGIVMTTGAEEMQRLTAGEGYQSGMLAKSQAAFFTVNGQNAMTKLSRTLSTTIGSRFILKAAAEGDHASLQRLGLDAGTVQRWDQAGRPALTPDMEGQQAEDARRMAQGMTQFVNESSLHPSKFQATGWGNNPYFKVAWYLKQFLWTFGDTILGGLYRNAKNQYGEARNQGYDRGMAAAQAMMPATMAAAYTMPLALMSIGLRSALAGEEPYEDEEPDELTFEAIRKAGAYAQWDLAASMWDAYNWDNPNDSLGQRAMNYGGALVPPISQADRLVKFQDDSWEPDLEKSSEALKDSAPLINQWKGTWQWLYE